MQAAVTGLWTTSCEVLRVVYGSGYQLLDVRHRGNGVMLMTMLWPSCPQRIASSCACKLPTTNQVVTQSCKLQVGVGVLDHAHQSISAQYYDNRS